ncbi:MAG: nucleotide exchange factor GrpE [Pyrinomonadaceae bacterium]
MFKKKTMTETEPIKDEILENDDEPVTVTDKRRFNEEGERQPEGKGADQPTRSAREIQLEVQLKAETERRVAAENKLVGVQAKFEELKSGLEKETTDLRARMTKSLEDRAKQAQFNFLTTLLPVLDNLNLAVAASEKDPSLDHLRDGVKGTARSFEQALMSVGVEPIQSVGAEFDPEMHEAVDMAAVDAEDDGKIVEEYSSGYKFGDRLLRPARVKVGKSAARSAG